MALPPSIPPLDLFFSPLPVMGNAFPSVGRVHDYIVDEFRKHFFPPPNDPSKPPALSQLDPPPPPPAVKPPAARDTARVKEKPPTAARVDAYHPALEKPGQTTAQRMERKEAAQKSGQGHDQDEDEEDNGEEETGARPRATRPPLKLKPLDTSPGEERREHAGEERAKEEKEEEGPVAMDVDDTVDAQSVAAAEPVEHVHLDTAPMDSRFIGEPDQARVS